ncbi:hypothetical protein TNCV_2647071 [Trichonephila clavipes]|nr:hypothetical protein TNCV_2647071 [Trichonephila clavipes]
MHQNLAEHGSFRKVLDGHEQPYSKRHAVDRNPGTSVRVLAVSVEISRITVHHVLPGKALLPFHVQRVQLLQPDDHARHVAFAQGFVNQSATDIPIHVA